MSSDDHEQFVGHYEENKDKVFTYLMYRLNFNREVCEDLLMDIFLKAYEHFHTFDSNKGSFKNWIFRIAHNHLVNFWRDDKKEASLDEIEEDSKIEAVSIDETISDQIIDEQIQHVLSLLSDTEREIITLRYLNDFSYQEIAEILNKNEGAVRTSLSRALEQFKKIYQKVFSNE